MEQENKEILLIDNKKKNPNKLFGIFCLIGACMIFFVFPSLFSFHTFAVYQTSYIKHNGGDANVTYTMFYFPVTLLFQSLFGLVSGILFVKVGVHWSNLIGTSIFLLAGTIMYISKRFYLDMISSALYGISLSVMVNPSLINTCKYHMNHIGLINGIIGTCKSLGTTLFTYLGEEIINPNRVKSNPKDHLYNKEISNNIKTFLLLQIFCALGAFLVCEIFTKTYDENNEEKFDIKFLLRINEIKKFCNKKEKESLIIIERANDVFSINPEIMEIEDDQNNAKNNKIKSKTRKEKIKMVLKSWKFWRYNLISLSQSPITNMIFSMYRSLGETHQINQSALQLLGTLNTIIGFIFSFIFGVLCDYVDFRILIFINNMIGTIVGITYYYSFHSTVGFTVLTLIISIENASFFGLKQYHFLKVYGIDILADLSGFIQLNIGICVIILTILTYFIQSKFEDKDSAYLIIFPSFGIFNFFGLILGFFEDDTPFDYGK